VVERLAERLGARFRKARFLALEVAEARAGDAVLFLARPLTFMNVSGPPLASFARKRGIPVDRVIACHDEIDLAFGALKLKVGGSTAGHHGLDSLAEAFRGAGFYRVRLGVGRPPGRQDPADYVLDSFSKVEREDAEVLADAGADAVLALATEGLTVAQDRYNRSGPRT
jgi:PTH1 family peptidyl-tRNA hydrolase